MKKRYAAAGLILSMLCGAAHARLTCEQLVAVAQTAVQLRNQGVALNVLLADVGQEDMKSRFSAAEIDVIRRTITQTYTGGLSPFEIRESCKDDTK